MKKTLIFATFALMGYFVSAQVSTSDVEIGDILTINKPKTADYQHIYFPRKNFIYKRGAIPTYKGIYNEEVEVINVQYSSKGDAIVTLKRTDGNKFFRFFPTVKANFDKAVKSGELL